MPNILESQTIEFKQDEKEYLKIVVQKTYAPVSYNGKFYKRSGSNTLELNGENLTNFLLKKYGKTWDDIAEENCTLDEIDLNTIEKFTQPHQSKPFNPTMASIFYKCGYIENWGRGTLNIISQCVEYGLAKPTFEYEWTAVVTTFYKEKNVGANVGANEVYNFIKTNEPIKVNIIAKEFSQVTQRTIERYIKQLKDEDKIEFKGASKTGGYVAK